MTEPTPQPSKAKRVLTSATKLALFLVMVGIVVQAGMTYFEEPAGGGGRAEDSTSAGDLGEWTFAGQGLGVTVRSIETSDMEAELRGLEPVAVDPTLPLVEGEKQLLVLLAAHPPTEKEGDGRRRWRQQFGGIEVFAETYKAGKDERLAIGRAAWTSGGNGLSLLEVRPQAGANAQSTAERLVTPPAGATEIARRMTNKGGVTGSLLLMKTPVDVAAGDVKRSLTTDGWKVDTLDLGDTGGAKAMTATRGGQRMQVVLMNEQSADGTMIMVAKE
jgi:hypothetical protein